MERVRQTILTLILVLGIASAAEARDWPQIPRAEWDLKEVPSAPGAPAVVLLDSGFLRFDERAVSSYFEVYRRVKILNEEGRDYATVSIPSSSFYRMRELQGRTHLPGGRVVPMDKDAKFEKKFSTFYKYSVHSFALPAVEVGSIIEYQYKVFFDNSIYTEPWYFQGELPQLRSEIVCEYPKTFGFAPVRHSPFGLKIHEDVTRTPNAHRTTYAMDNVPPVPDEPARYPFQDLASWALFIPQEMVSGGQVIDLLKDWDSAVEIMQGYGKVGYKAALKGSRSAKTQAKSLAGVAKDSRDKAVPIYEFVRDSIKTEHYTGVGVGERTVDKTLKEKRGDYADKALLLQAMLKAVKVPSKLCWIRPKDQGRTQQALPTPFQFDQMLVVLELGGEKAFLDPTDTELAFGELPPNFEGIPCFLNDGKSGEWVTTPARPAEANERFVRLRLEIDEDGALGGIGNLWLKGHHAWGGRKAGLTEDNPLDYWSDWLERRLDGFEITDVELDETIEDPGLNLRWRLTQKAAEVLGDEVSFEVAKPLGLASNPFSLAPGRRRTPVQLEFADVDRVEVHLRWPEGWKIDAEPQLKALSNGAGSLETRFEVDAVERKLVATRRFEIKQTEFVGSDPYRHLHQLFADTTASDAESVVLVLE